MGVYRLSLVVETVFIVSPETFDLMKLRKIFNKSHFYLFMY